MVAEAPILSKATRRVFYPLALIDFALAGHFAFQSRWAWLKAIEEAIAYRPVGTTLSALLWGLPIVGGFAVTGCLILRKRWLPAAIGQATLTVGLVGYTGLALLWMLVSGPGKHYDPQNGITQMFALVLVTFVSLIDTRRLFHEARASRYGAVHAERG